MVIQSGAKRTKVKVTSNDTIGLILPLDSLVQGPDIRLDSFRVERIGMYLRNDFIPSSWTALVERSGIYQYDRKNVSDDTGRTAFHVGNDTDGNWRAAGITRSMQYGQGTVAISFDKSDSARWPQVIRTISLLDSAGDGMALRLDTISDMNPGNLMMPSLSGFLSTLPDSNWIRPTGWSTTAPLVWYFTWTGTKIVASNSAGWSGSLDRTFSSPPILTVRVEAEGMATPLVVHLSQIRLYSP